LPGARVIGPEPVREIVTAFLGALQRGEPAANGTRAGLGNKEAGKWILVCSTYRKINATFGRSHWCEFDRAVLTVVYSSFIDPVPQGTAP